LFALLRTFYPSSSSPRANKENALKRIQPLEKRREALAHSTKIVTDGHPNKDMHIEREEAGDPPVQISTHLGRENQNSLDCRYFSSTNLTLLKNKEL
jgi:hypothetical protein